MEKIRAGAEDSQLSGSAISGLSDLEDDTDQFGRVVLQQYARDEQRMSHVTGGHAQVLRKARPQARVATALNYLDDCDGANAFEYAREDYYERRVPSRSSSNDSEPPLNIPRDWGRKARHSKSWLQRIDSPERHVNGYTPARIGVDGSPAWPSGRNGAVQAATVATPPLANRQRPASTPASIHSRGVAPKLDQEWDGGEDFTGVSLLASTPAVPTGRKTLDEIRRLEHGDAQPDVVNRARLSQHWARARSETPPRDAMGQSGAPLTAGRIAAGHGISTDSQHVGQYSYDKENRPLHALPNGTSDFADVKTSHASTEQTRSTSVQKKTDSIGLLKRLARASSSSPIGVTDEPKVDMGKETKVVFADKPVGEKAADIANELETPAARRIGLSAKTPIVTGAWIDTPAGKVVDAPQPIQPASSLEVIVGPTTQPAEEQPRRVSALSDLVHDARSHQQDTLGDETLNSLEGLLDPTLEVSQTLELNDLQAEIDRLHDAGRPFTQADKDRRQELLAVEAMNTRLRAARTSIKDASRGLRRVERTVDAAAEAADAASRSHSQHQHSAGGCAVCGRQQSVFTSMREEVRAKLFTWDAKRTRRFGVRLTWLGLLCLAVLGWWLAENALCSFYCHPLYASHMVAYGVDPSAPRYPFVLPTLFFRPWRFVWSPVLRFLAWSLGPILSFVYAAIMPSVSTAGPFSSSSMSTSRPPGYRYDTHYGGPAWRDVMFGHGVWQSRELGYTATTSTSRLLRTSSVTNGRATVASQSGTWDDFGHLEKGNAWSSGEMEWEAGPGDDYRRVGQDSMGDDEVL